MSIDFDSDRFDRSSSAVVVVDVQNDFCAEDGVQGQSGKDLSRVDTTVSAIVGFVDWAKANGIPVVYVYTTHGPEVDSPQWLARRAHATGKGRPNCVQGTWGSELFRLDPDAADVTIEKHRYSGFSNPSMEPELRARGISSLFFCGYTTEVCVETTLRDAVDRDFYASLVVDCADAYTVPAHERAVTAVTCDFGAVVTSDELREVWAKQG